MVELAKLQKLLLQESLDRYEEEYKELLETWRDLERKAQAMTTIAGVFLAGAFAFIRQLPSPVSFDIKLLLFLTIGLLVPVFLCSILVFSVRERSLAPSSAITYRFVTDLLRFENADELEERIPWFINDCINAWVGINDSIIELIRVKANSLWKAQIFLLADMVVVSALAIFSVFKL